MNNWQGKFKTKEEAVVHIVSMFQDEPGTAGLDGTLGIILGNNLITIRPKKKKQQYEEN